MLYITGDTHGKVERFEKCAVLYGLTEEDSLIVAGDFGCIFGLGMQDEDKLDALESLPYTVLFIDGNHECFPKLNSYPEECWNGGRVHRIRSNILHLMRGQVYCIDGIIVFTMGGGYSVDKMYRVPGKSWWPEEMPSEEEYEEAWKNLRAHGNKVDVIISHATPKSAMDVFVETGVIWNPCLGELELNLFLEDIQQSIEHKHYYFGHMHIDKRITEIQTALYYDVYRLETGERMTVEVNNSTEK